MDSFGRKLDNRLTTDQNNLNVGDTRKYLSCMARRLSGILVIIGQSLCYLPSVMRCKHQRKIVVAYRIKSNQEPRCWWEGKINILMKKIKMTDNQGQKINFRIFLVLSSWESEPAWKSLVNGASEGTSNLGSVHKLNFSPLIMWADTWMAVNRGREQGRGLNDLSSLLRDKKLSRNFSTVTILPGRLVGWRR